MFNIRHQFNTLLCRVLGHEDEYTDEYESYNGHVRADAVCQRCDRRELAWTGPKAETIRNLGYTIP